MPSLSGHLRDCGADLARLAALVRRLWLYLVRRLAPPRRLRPWRQPALAAPKPIGPAPVVPTAVAPGAAVPEHLQKALNELDMADRLFNEAREQAEIDRAILRLNLARAEVDEHLRLAAQEAERGNK